MDEMENKTPTDDITADDAIAQTISELQTKYDQEKARADKAENQVKQLTKIMRNQSVIHEEPEKKQTFSELCKEFFKK